MESSPNLEIDAGLNTFDETIDASNDSESEDIDTKFLNNCSKDFNSLLFVVPPEIRTEENSTASNSDEENEDTIDSNMVENILATVGEESLSTSEKNSNSYSYNFPEDPNKKKSFNCFKFPDGGWVCLSCQNYNFYGRLKCNRCGKMKTKYDPIGKPKHLLHLESNETDLNGIHNKKQLVERLGDWMCAACHNINFAFRQQCNRCKRLKSFIGILLSEQYISAMNLRRQVRYCPKQCIPCRYPTEIQE